MDTFLHLAFKNACPRRLVKTGYFQDMSRIDPVVRSPSHHTFAIDLVLIDRHLEMKEPVRKTARSKKKKDTLTPL